MGLLKRVLGGLNRAGGAAHDWAPTDPRYRTADRVLEHGIARAGHLVGIERRLEGGTDEQHLALVADGEATRGGVRITAPWLHRLRLGMPVALRVDDGGGAVLDGPGMCAAWGIPMQGAAQRLIGSAPPDGCRDRALDGRVQKALQRWTPARATIAAVERKMALGMPTTDFALTLELAGGGRTTASQHVPFYAAWLTCPGAEVPVVVDPDRPERTYVDFPAAAGEAADRAGRLADDPPAGSVAAILEGR